MKAFCHHFDGKDMAFLPFLQIFEKLISSYIRHQTSAIIHLTSYIIHQTSYIRHQTSDIRHQPSSETGASPCVLLIFKLLNFYDIDYIPFFTQSKDAVFNDITAK